ncbi:MAG: acyl-CoA dehydrogenase family protein [Flavobacteriales bacterium]|nr:acyl-CoA dehydrogenase family protein [Flavobacteriales bacterium]
MSNATPHSDFLQKAPQLGNEFLDDQFLRDYLAANLPEDVFKEIAPDLERFGKLVTTDCIAWAREAETNPPQLTQFDAWGKRVDEIKVSQGWLGLERVAAEEGLVAIGYERKYGAHSRLYQFATLYLYTASSAIYTSPLAMTDGAARLIELHGDDFLRKGAYPGLTSRNPAEFLTSGQWMTERTGGSDVSRSMTIAVPAGEHFALHGHKWFTSAITANMAFTLASTDQPENGGRAPLSLFHLPIRNDDGSLNHIEVEALKDKLGTRALPTAQLKLLGSKARMVGQKGRGVPTIATLFNITRIYNTVSAVSYMRRAFALSAAYGKERSAFGKPVGEHVLYRRTLRELEIAYQSNALLALFLTRLLGKEECNVATAPESALLRLLTPVGKLYTAKQAIASASEHIEMFGGLGYLEDSGIPVMLRDAQTLSIWEGTTNVLSLDMLRAMAKENGLEGFRDFAEPRLQEQHGATPEQWRIIQGRYTTLMTFLGKLATPMEKEASARDMAFYIAELTIALLWAEFIASNRKDGYRSALDYWLNFKINEQTLNSAAILGPETMNLKSESQIS